MEVFKLKKYDLDDVKRLVELAEKSDLGVLEIETKKGRRIRIERNSKSNAPVVSLNSDIHTEAVPQAVPVQPAVPTAPAQVSPAPAAPVASKTIDAPMVGVFYQSPSPEAEPYVKVGQSVKKGDIVCIIEAMKLMNEFRLKRTALLQKY